LWSRIKGHCVLITDNGATFSKEKVRFWGQDVPMTEDKPDQAHAEECLHKARDANKEADK